MKALPIITPYIVLIGCLFYCIYLAHSANLRAEHFRLLFEDAESIVDQQSHTLENSANNVDTATIALQSCIDFMRTYP